MNRLRMEQRAGVSSAKRELERVKRDMQKMIEAIKAGFALPELKVEMDALQLRKRCSRSWLASTNRRRSCTRAWPTSTGTRSRSSPPHSSARTRAWKPQKCSVG